METGGLCSGTGWCLFPQPCYGYGRKQKQNMPCNFLQVWYSAYVDQHYLEELCSENILASHFGRENYYLEAWFWVPCYSFLAICRQSLAKCAAALPPQSKEFLALQKTEIRSVIRERIFIIWKLYFLSLHFDRLSSLQRSHDLLLSFEEFFLSCVEYRNSILGAFFCDYFFKRLLYFIKFMEATFFEI